MFDSDDRYLSFGKHHWVPILSALNLLFPMPVLDGHIVSYLTGISFQWMSFMTSTIQKLEGLSILFDEGSTPTRIDFVAAVGTEFDLHDESKPKKEKNDSGLNIILQ